MIFQLLRVLTAIPVMLIGPVGITSVTAPSWADGCGASATPANVADLPANFNVVRCHSANRYVEVGPVEVPIPPPGFTLVMSQTFADRSVVVSITTADSGELSHDVATSVAADEGQEV